MTPVPESAEWILKALIHCRESANLVLLQHESPSSSPKGGRERSDLRSSLKQALLPLYRLIRPVLRPLLWRFRAFMIGPLSAQHQTERDLLASFTAKLDGLGADIRCISSIQAELREELNQLRQQVNQLQDELDYIGDDLNFGEGSMQNPLAKDVSQRLPKLSKL